MKKKISSHIAALFLGIITAIVLGSCADSLTKIDNDVKFEQLKEKKVYLVYNDDGTPKMVADSQFSSVFDKGKLVSSVKVGKKGTERQVSYVGKDSLATFGPSGGTVRRLLDLNPLKEIRIIWGIVCLILMTGIWVWAGIVKLHVVRGAIFLLIIPSFILFYMGMQAIQKKTYDAARNNSKTLHPAQYRHYFSEDPQGTYFWDSVYKANGFIGLK